VSGTPAGSGLRLTLMRHGRAEGNDPQLSDFDRSLDRRGVSEVVLMGQRLTQRGLVPDLILASPASRTLQTAQILLREFAPNVVVLRLEPRLYLAPAGTVAEVVRNSAADAGHVLLVGHNPGLTEFARWLAPDCELPGFGTAATCTMLLECPAWGLLCAAVGREVDPDHPGVEPGFSTNRRG
jgi:phosphohistidine phosphatase